MSTTRPVLPGFTAEIAVGLATGSGRAGRAGRAAGDPTTITPQQREWWDCSDDGALCYDCYDDGVTCGCDWFYNKHYVVSSDCGTG